MDVTAPVISSPDTAEAPDVTLSVSSLATTFGSAEHPVRALRGINMELRRGKTTVLLGESGSGKSVTARSILRLYNRSVATEGSVLYGDLDLLQMDESEMRPLRGSVFGFVPQDPTGSLDPLRSVGKQLVEVLRLHDICSSKAEAKVRAEELLDLVGLPDPARAMTSYPHELSGGMKQRVAIALAISCDPLLLIADEPTTALDVTVQAQILELFEELTERLGSALLMITHDVGVAADVAHDVYVMYAGLVVESGPAKDVLEDPYHPYTRALLESIPSPEQRRGELIPIPGQPPIAGRFDSGCAFRTRCSLAQDSCATAVPALQTTSDGRSFACDIVEHAGVDARQQDVELTEHREVAL